MHAISIYGINVLFKFIGVLYYATHFYESMFAKKKKKKSVEPSIQFVFCELEMPFQAILLDFFFCVTMSLGKEEKARARQGKSSVLLI